MALSHIAKAVDMVRLFGARAASHVLADRARRRTSFQAPLPGDAREVSLRFGSSDYAVYRKIFAEREYAYPPDVSPSVIIDAGANIGLASIFFALQYPGALILALEPERDNFELLCRNVAAFSSIRAIRAALWSELGRASVVDAGRGSWGFRIEPTTGTSDSVPATTVDRLMAEFNVDHVDILKMDIEGSEREVLCGSGSWIPFVGSIVAELHDRYSPGSSRAFYSGTRDFDWEWHRGENVFVARSGLVPTAPYPDAVRVRR